VFAVEDHRAEAEAEELKDVSAAMHLPRLLWLRRRAPATWARVTATRDLCDELTRRATGVDAVSFGSLVTQWPFLPENGWRQALLDGIGLDDLPMLGAFDSPPRAAGQLHGALAPDVAGSFGLPVGIPVAAGLIDDHAAALGVLGRGARARMNETLLLINGDSKTAFAFAPEARVIAGVRGPFRHAVLPGYWLHVVERPTGAEILETLNANGFNIARVAIVGERERLAADLVVTEAAHPALCGTAMIAAVAARLYPDLFVALDLMSPPQYRYAASIANRI
jgi:ribulose kinase